MNDLRHAHEQWVSHMQGQGWSYGETYDEGAKKDPRMVPFDMLPTVEATAETAEEAPADPDTTDKQVDDHESPAEEPTIDDLAEGDVGDAEGNFYG